MAYMVRVWDSLRIPVSVVAGFKDLFTWGSYNSKGIAIASSNLNVYPLDADNSVPGNFLGTTEQTIEQGLIEGGAYTQVNPHIQSGIGLRWNSGAGRSYLDVGGESDWARAYDVTRADGAFSFIFDSQAVQLFLVRRYTGGYGAPTEVLMFSEWFNGHINLYELVTETDPYAPGGTAGNGGGTGNFDGTTVDVDFAQLPTLSAVDTGFVTLYNPTLGQLQSLATYMWSNLFDLDTFKKLFGDPMDAILGLSIVPGPVPSSGAQVVKVGNVSTNVNMTKAASQYIDIDCGTLNVEEFWGAYLDYEPYTKAEIYLPFIGVHQIAVDDIMNKPVHIKYHIDLLSGGCACEIKCGGSVLYTFIGSCAISIPVTGSDWTNLINGVLSAASAIGTMVATGGATAPAAAGEIASAAINSLKPSIEKSGSVAGAGGLLAGKVPVLILTRPRQALPGKQNTFTGYPAFITRSLGGLSGYTEVHSIRLSGIDGTESEIDEIEELLKGGVIL